MSPTLNIQDQGNVVLVIQDQELADYIRHQMPESVSSDGNIEIFINKGDDVLLHKAIQDHIKQCDSKTK
jgi:hypothetical protein